MGNETKWVQINAIVSPSQRERLKDNARKCEMSISQLISKMITSTQIDISPGLPAQLRELNCWLGRINSNTNMLSHHANIYREKADADLIIYQLNVIARELNELSSLAEAIKKNNHRRKAKEASTS